jgi:tetratricopeptide (TPR) repeat protein
VQNGIVTRILNGLGVKLTGEDQQRLAKRYTDNKEAYYLYLKGRSHALVVTSEGLDRAIAYFDEAIALDKDYALAYAAKAEAYLWNSALNVEDTVPKAREPALEALRLDKDLSEAHCALAVVKAWVDWDWKAAETEFETTRKLDPASSCYNDNYGPLFASIGRQEDASIALNRALRLEPHSGIRHANLGSAYYYWQQYDQAITELNTALELHPQYWLARFIRAQAYEQKGMYNDAIKDYESLPDDFVGKQPWLARGLALAGRKGDAGRILSQIRRGTARQDPWGMAAAYLALDDIEETFKWLGIALDQRFFILPTLKVEPAFLRLRNDDRYKKLLRSMNLEP